MGIVSNILSDRLSRSLGEDLSLDIIEVNARDNWKSATFMVGKYLTENLFLTYERSFGEGDQNVTNPETISLEYQVSKSFFLQLIQGDAKVSGLDMFFKIEW
jgi:autotransporter translocation and assembly factor TamB